MRYKLDAAHWYIDLLDELGDRFGFSRLVGVEMALDGAAVALSGAFDAAVAGFIRAEETDLPEGEKTPAHLLGWKVAGPRMRRTEGRTQLAAEVDQALGDRAPLGWLTVLRRLRNRTAHENTLSRHIAVSVGGHEENRADWQLTVDGVGRDPVEYLREAHQLVSDLVMKILPLAAATPTTASNDRRSVTVHVPAAQATALTPYVGP